MMLDIFPGPAMTEQISRRAPFFLGRYESLPISPVQVQMKKGPSDTKPCEEVLKNRRRLCRNDEDPVSYEKR